MTTVAHKPDKLIYLSSPYSHEDAQMRHLRYQLALMTVAHYLHEGMYLYSPILHNHPIVCYKDLGTADEWLRYDYAVLDRCDEMWLLLITGWDASMGCKAELARCVTRGIRYKYIDPPFPIMDAIGFKDFGGQYGRQTETSGT